MNNIEMLIKNRLEIRNDVMLHLFSDLLGTATRKMRGISLNYSGKKLSIQVFFDSELNEEEEDEMLCMDLSFIASLGKGIYNYKDELILEVELVGTNFFIVPCEIDIYDREGNLGWIFLRKEYI